MRAGCCLLNRAWYIAGRIYGVVAVLTMERLPGSGTGHYLSGVIVALGLPVSGTGQAKTGEKRKTVNQTIKPYKANLLPMKILPTDPRRTGL